MKKLMLIVVAVFALLVVAGCQTKPVTQQEATVAAKILQDDKASKEEKSRAGKTLEQWKRQQKTNEVKK
jgi:hypothetical protein